MQRSTTIRCTARRGNALILVVLIAVAIIGVMMVGQFGGNQSYLQNVKSSKDKMEATIEDMTVQSIITDVVAFHTENGRYPKSIDELAGDTRQLYDDPWGAPLRLVITEQRGQPVIITITSAGEDGQFDTEDDQVEVRNSPI